MRRSSRHSIIVWGIIALSAVGFFSRVRDQSPVPTVSLTTVRAEAARYYQSDQSAIVMERAPSTIRIGAICRDGWESSATGRGACSHHGGVDHWLYR